MAVDIGQAVVSPLKAIGQLLMIKTKKVHPGRLEVVHVHWIFGYTEAQIIRLTVDMPSLHSATGHNHGITIREVIATQYFTF